MLKSVPLFADCDAAVIAALAECLQPQFYLENDVLCREGQVSYALVTYGLLARFWVARDEHILFSYPVSSYSLACLR